jgi:phage major head subunit gpT-like protein
MRRKGKVDKYDKIQELADNDVQMLREKNKKYGESWKRRGGVGAFMMLARKWDRIEVAASEKGWDIFKAFEEKGGESLQDTIADLRAYLLLVEEECLRRHAGEGASHAYVNQD